MGAIVIDRITVGAAAFLGAGAIVVRDVPANVQVMGPTARTVRADDEGR